MPKAVAIIGASTNRAKYGNRAVRAYLRQGWQVYPVNPNEREVEGLAAHASLADVPAPVERVALYVPAEVGVQVLAEVAARAPVELYVNPGAESAELVAEAERRGLAPILACAIRAIGERP